MRDPGLKEAIRAVGGVSELARQLRISQPSISNWTRVPAERVAAVESLTGVNRVVLRPDLFNENHLKVNPMRDSGLKEAIRAVGGVSELARQMRISQPSVSNWTRVPAERVASVESLTGVNRVVLRPDLFSENQMAGDVDETDAARAQEYALLSALLVRAPGTVLLKRLAALRGDASPLGVAHVALAEAASRATVEQVEREFFNLFIGVGRGELMPYGSYYLTGFLHERPLARLREDLGRFGIERTVGNAEPEDHAATLCEIMAGLAGGRFGVHAGGDQEIFENHMASWMGRFFGDLERAEAANFYRSVGSIGRLLMDIETEAFALNA